MADTDYTDAGLTNGSTYAWHVTAVNESGKESAPTADASTKIAKGHKRPKSPVKIAATIPSGDLVRLTWDNASLADAAPVVGYNVYRRVAGAEEFAKITPAPTPYKLFYEDTKNAGLAAKYDYAVTAVDAFGNESLQSASVKASEGK